MKKKKTLPIPDGFTEKDIKIESSVCTGEKTIGFYSGEDKKLHYAELVRSDEDIYEFYCKYGVKQLKGQRNGFMVQRISHSQRKAVYKG